MMKASQFHTTQDLQNSHDNPHGFTFAVLLFYFNDVRCILFQ